MLIIGVMAIAGSLFAVSVSMGLVALPDRAVRARLAVGVPVEQAQAKRMKQLGRLEGTERRVMSQRMFKRLERNLVLAGHPDGWTLKKIALVKVVLPIVMLLFAARFALFTGKPVMVVIGLVAIVVSYFVPDLLAHSRAVERQEQMQRDLPDVLDKIIISIEAGLGFESALASTASAGKGPLADELVRTIQDISLGVSRRQAYEALQRRTSSEDITAFVRGVIQAEEHGSPKNIKKFNLKSILRL